MSSKNTIYFVVGATATGKSRWALTEAQNNNGIIINADSVQFYKDLNIGSAKPTREEMSLVPHFLYDVAAPDHNFTAGDYGRLARKIISENIENNNIYVVGGSGFYLQALEKGMFQVPPIPISISQQVEAIKTSDELHAELKKIDEQAASKIGPTDPYRLARALSVVLTVGKTMAEIEAEFLAKQIRLGDQYTLKKVGFQVDRELLRARVHKRTIDMLQNGWLPEVQSLLANGHRGSRALSSVGYRECVEFLENKISRENLAPLIVTSTMQLAKRQWTWFKRDSDIEWLSTLDRVLKQEQ